MRRPKKHTRHRRAGETAAVRWQAELPKLRTTLTGQPMTVARFAAALTTISKSGGVWAQIVLIGLKWFYMEMGMSVLVQGCRAVLGEYSVRRC
jgi:hypothetical protein